MRTTSLLALSALSLAAVACSDSTTPAGAKSLSVSFHTATNTTPVASRSGAFGPRLSLMTSSGSDTLVVGDSVLITVSVADTARMIVRFEPSGLRFDPQVPARLKMNFGEADGDYNGDGVVNAEDSSVESQFSMWRQEQPGLPWVKLGSAVVEDLKEVEADITGFSGYAISY